ncbi:MAG: glycosyltransferase family 4 protein [Sandaracinaceae bacterium]|nr:glycosyltransferase family 4 protein [Sandaracinaceae bacterium]
MPKSGSPRLCILTQFYPPEMGAPQARLSESATRLIEAGWTVEVLTALPNYPAGKIFDGYNALRPVVERINGARVVRVPMYPSKEGVAKRLASYLSFAASAASLGPLQLSRPDLLWVESPPIFIGPAAWALSTRWRCPYVLNVSDLWPESIIRVGMMKSDAPTTRALQLLEHTMYKRAAGITGQSTEIIKHVAAIAPNVPTEEITNGVDPTRFGKRHADAHAKSMLGEKPGPIFMYAGLFGWAQGLDQILDLAKAWPADAPGRFVLVGDGPERERLGKRVDDEKLDRVTLLPAQPRERIPALLAAADIAIVSLGMTIPGAVPSKIYEAMASSLPILLIADGEPARRIEGCGTAVNPGDGTALLAAGLTMARDESARRLMGASGRALAEGRYHRDRIASRLDSFLRARIAP